MCRVRDVKGVVHYYDPIEMIFDPTDFLLPVLAAKGVGLVAAVARVILI